MSDAPTLVLDLDGTLVDTAPDLVTALNLALTGRGLRRLGAAEAIAMVGHGARMLVERGALAAGGTGAKEEVDELYRTFLDGYAAHIADESRPFPGVTAALDRFAASGWRLAICTNKLEYLSRMLTDALGLTGRFAAICGGDTFPFRKPDPRHLLATIERAGGNAASSIMVGDSAADIDAARAAGVPVVAVDFGYTTVPVSELGPDRVISHFDALSDAVQEILARDDAVRSLTPRRVTS